MQGDRNVGSDVRTKSAATSNSADPTVPANWLAQKICVDADANVVRVDPYSGSNAFGDACPAGYSIRNLREADPVPYFKYYNPIVGSNNATRYRYTNAYEALGAGGQTLYIMDRQFQPSNVRNDWYVNQSFYPGASQWDTYEINDGWVSNATSRDSTGMNQTFFGSLSGTSIPYNGWIDFPTAYFSGLTSYPRPQSTYVPVRGLYWEQAGLPWPLPPQSISHQNPDTQTTWELLPHYTFDSGKTMNALVSYHQSQPRPSDRNPDDGHIEAWFFTVPYGPTRWEVWSAATCLASSCSSYIKSSCRTRTATATFSYKGSNYTYYRTNCVDWEQGTSLVASRSTVPTLPVPQANLLRNFHFSADPVNTSQSAAGWELGSTLLLAQLQSKAAGDTRNGGYAGVRYARIACNANCASSSTLSQTIALTHGGSYSFGVEAETEVSSGMLTVSLAQTDDGGRVLDPPNTIGQLVNSAGDGSNCVTHPRVENCALYIGGRARIDLKPGATMLRVTVQPRTAGVYYDVTDVFLSEVKQ